MAKCVFPVFTSAHLTRRVHFQWLRCSNQFSGPNYLKLSAGNLLIAHHYKNADNNNDQVALYFVKEDKLKDRCELGNIEPSVDFATSTFRGDDYILLPSSDLFLDFFLIRQKNMGIITLIELS